MTNPIISTNHPSHETLAALVDGRLDPQSRKTIIEHIAVCDDCRADWQTISDFTAEEASEQTPPNVTTGNFGGRRWYPLIAVAAVLALGFALWPIAQTYLNRDALIEASASRKDRPSDARLSGDHPYREPERVMRSGEERDDFDEDFLGVYGPAAEILREAQKNRTPENLRRLAAVHLLTEKWDNAVKTGEEALRLETGTGDPLSAIRQSKNAPLLVDLSAAYIARGRRSDARGDYLLALEASKQALNVSRTSEAIWNNALALQMLGLREDAREAWSDYLKNDPNSPWAEEARQRLSELDADQHSAWSESIEERLRQFLDVADETNVRAIATKYPKEARTLGEEELLAEWGIGRSEQALRRVELLARVVAASGDQLLNDSVAAIRSATPDIRRRLEAAHATYGKARGTLRNQPTQALALYREIAPMFEQAGSPFAALTRLRIAACLHRTTAYADALRTLDTAIAPAETLAARGYLALAAQVEWTRAVTNADFGMPAAALDCYERALGWFRRLRETPNEASVRIRLAQVADAIGERENALEHRLEALSLAALSPASLDQHALFTEAALALTTAGYLHTARVIVDRLVASAEIRRQPDELCTALLWRSFHLARAQTFDRAQLEWNRAASYCARVEDPLLRRRLGENEAFVAAAIAGGSDPALPNLDEAIAFSERTGNRYRSAMLLAARARVLLSRRDFSAARSDAERGMQEIARQLATVQNPDFRVSLLDAAREIVGHKIEVDVSRGDVASAFAAAEWHRSQATAAADGGPRGVTLEDVRGVLAADAALLAFYVSAERTTIFAITAKHAEARTIERSSTALASDVAALREAIAPNDSEGIARSAKVLYSTLVEPFERTLSTTRTLLVLPDGVLTTVPFALLTDRRGRLLIERHRIIALSAASALLRQSECRTASAGGRVVIVGGAERDRADELPLEQVSREISQIASLYSDVQILSGDSATPDAFLAASSAEILHYGGHASASPAQPKSSALILPAGEDGIPRRLWAYQIAAKDWSSLRMVVIAGCGSSARDAVARPLGSLAEAFLAGGAQAVVGTLWDVDDAESRGVSVRIHRATQAGALPADAVRQVQLQMLNSDSVALRAPRAWAGWLVSGGCDGRK